MSNNQAKLDELFKQYLLLTPDQRMVLLPWVFGFIHSIIDGDFGADEFINAIELGIQQMKKI